MATRHCFRLIFTADKRIISQKSVNSLSYARKIAPTPKRTLRSAQPRSRMRFRKKFGVKWHTAIHTHLHKGFGVRRLLATHTHLHKGFVFVNIRLSLQTRRLGFWGRRAFPGFVHCYATFRLSRTLIFAQLRPMPPMPDKNIARATAVGRIVVPFDVYFPSSPQIFQSAETAASKGLFFKYLWGAKAG